jgi:DNA-binding beta-propeller fold protein YncE
MTRTITRSYAFSQSDVREALIAWMKSKDLQAPMYVGDTPSGTTWTVTEDGGHTVTWIDEDEVQ